jgi:hypothetical protein
MIGFDYHRLPALDAAADLMARLRRIREQQADDEYLVTIALDGENAWDFYPRDGHDFLNALYSELEADENIVTTTVSGYLERVAERRPLHRLHTGSWIGASLDTWIGDPEHNVAWDLLAQTRGWLEDFGRHHPAESETVAAAWREIMIAEGSDWFWWYSRKHDSGMDAIWDNQFRLHLRNVYKLVGARPPARLFQPILERPWAPRNGCPKRPSRRAAPTILPGRKPATSRLRAASAPSTGRSVSWSGSSTAPTRSASTSGSTALRPALSWRRRTSSSASTSQARPCWRRPIRPLCASPRCRISDSRLLSPSW